MEYNKLNTYQTTIDESNENDVLFINQCKKYDELMKITTSMKIEEVERPLIIEKLNTI